MPRRPTPRCSSATGLWWRCSWTLVLGCSPTGPASPTIAMPSSDGSTSSDVTAVEPPAGADICAQAPVIGAGRYVDTLWARTSAGGGACGNGGPDVFYRLYVPARVDVRVQATADAFQPIVGVRPGDCELPWDSALACGPATSGWLRSIRPGTELLVTAGSLAESSRDAPGPAPLAFELSVRFRRILPAFSPCLPDARFRCDDGTSCWNEVCTPIEGDHCGVAIPLNVPSADELSQDGWGGPPANDAHEHTCGPTGVSERVYRLVLPPAQGRDLEIASTPETVLAVRGSSCAPEDELACAEGRLRITQAQLAEHSELYVFVEQTSGGEPQWTARFSAPQNAAITLPDEPSEPH